MAVLTVHNLHRGCPVTNIGINLLDILVFAAFLDLEHLLALSLEEKSRFGSPFWHGASPRGVTAESLSLDLRVVLLDRRGSLHTLDFIFCVALLAFAALAHFNSINLIIHAQN